jgi:hypothetical protein
MFKQKTTCFASKHCSSHQKDKLWQKVSIVSNSLFSNFRKSTFQKYFYSLTPIFVASAKCSDHWVLELSEPQNPRKLKSHD